MAKKKTIEVKDIFKVGSNNIAWVSDNFKKWFYKLPFNEKESKDLEFKTLKKRMTVKEILQELKPSAVLLEDIIKEMNGTRLLKNGYANLFYVKDKDNILRAVNVRWDGWYGDWNVYAHDVESPSPWDDGDQVFSRNFDTLALDSLPTETKKKNKIIKGWAWLPHSDGIKGKGIKHSLRYPDLIFYIEKVPDSDPVEIKILKK